MARKKSIKGKGSYATYVSQDSFVLNRKRKLEKRIKNHPNDNAAVRALANISYTRNKSRNKIWSKTKIAFAKLLGQVGSNGHIALCQPDDKSGIMELESAAIYKHRTDK